MQYIRKKGTRLKKEIVIYTLGQKFRVTSSENEEYHICNLKRIYDLQ